MFFFDVQIIFSMSRSSSLVTDNEYQNECEYFTSVLYPPSLTDNCFILVVDLVGLLRWKANKREIPSVLTSLLKIDGEEIVKVHMCIMLYMIF